MAGAAPHRIGQPSPLIFHLGAALSAYGHALLAAPRADSPSFPWGAALGVERAALADLDQVEVAREIAARLQATVAGLEIWQAPSLPPRAGRSAGGVASRLLAAPRLWQGAGGGDPPGRRCWSCRA